MSRLAVLLALLLAATAARAGEAVLTWTPPAKNCDGSALTDLQGFRAYKWSAFEEVANPLATTITVKGLTPGRWGFGVSAYSAGGESNFIGPVYKEVLPAEFVTVAPTVYTVVKGTDRFIFLPVGTTALGVVCDATQPVGSYHVIPKAGVTWTGSTRPVVVVASCG